MKTEAEIKEFMKRLSKITGYIAKFGDNVENNHHDVGYLRNLADALNWVMDNMSSNQMFKKNLKRNESDEVEIYQIIEAIEERTGNKFVEFK